LQSTIGSHNSHLHEYEIVLHRYGIPDDEWPSTEPVIDERRVRLKPLIDDGLRRFAYLYDFVDHWEHSVKVEDLVPPTKGGPLIVCLAGENACPLEDVGGYPRSAEVTEAVQDPAHEEHASMLR
jgi:hypothetical protein